MDFVLAWRPGPGVRFLAGAEAEDGSGSRYKSGGALGTAEKSGGVWTGYQTRADGWGPKPGPFRSV